jgi:hypothetical protein
MFASSLARHFEVEEDVVEDLKLAISEACSRALAAANGDGRGMSLTVARKDERLVFEVTQGEIPPATEHDTPTPSQEELAAGMSLELITALFEDAEMTADPEGHPVVRFSIP